LKRKSLPWRPPRSTTAEVWCALSS
jgi:hypothetical protein